MTRFLVATASVHVTAAAADYLEERLEPGADEVVVVGVRDAGAPGRDSRDDRSRPFDSRSPAGRSPDVDDAANVARARLAAATPETEVREGDVVDELFAAVEEHDPDEVVVGAHGGVDDGNHRAQRGDAERARGARLEQVGSTARALLTGLDRPVVVVPVDALE